MATREPPVELFYDPAELDPAAPRLYVLRNGATWELQDEDGAVLGTHPTQRDAIEEAHERSATRFCEILARGSTGRIEWRIEQNSMTREAMEYWRKRRSRSWRQRIGVGAFAGHHVPLRPRWRYGEPAVGRAASVDLFYDPADLDPDAPRLCISKTHGLWELRDNEGTVLSCHSSLPDAIDAGVERSRLCFSEILFRGSTGGEEWSVRHNPDWVALARALNRTDASMREAAD
jgi:hypothetical protein